MFILMDVEGTTTSIDFVHKTLFPYSYEVINDLDPLIDHNDELKKLWVEAKRVCSEIGERNLDDGDVIDMLRRWIKEDRKEPVLKNIQGVLWQQGYEQKKLTGHVYPDVPKAFERWKQNGLKLGIFSSGSVLAQKQLFAHTEYGDLTHFFEAHFDTAVGGKREASSYQVIAHKLGLKAQEIFFLTDIKEELQAATEAGFRGCLLVREGELRAVDHFATAQNFDEVDSLF